MSKTPFQKGQEYADAASAAFFAFATIVLASPLLLASGGASHWSDYVVSLLGFATWAGIIYAVAVILGVA